MAMRIKIQSVPSPTQAVWELILASSIWGFGFICTRWALDFAGPFWLNAIRFHLAFWPLLPILFLIPRFRTHASWEQFRLAFFPGIFLSSAILLQTAGLPYTTVTKSGFITVLYIVFVPLFEHLFLKSKIHFLHYCLVGIALLGSALICEFTGGVWNRGDVLTLGCAIVASIQIIWLENYADRIQSPFVFNLFQSFWAGLLPLGLAPFFEVLPQFPMPQHALAGFIMLAFGSSMFAFMIQVRTQKVLSSSMVSMLFLLESPFAAFFAYFIFREQMSFQQWLGAGLILLSAAATVAVHSYLDSRSRGAHDIIN